MAGITRETRQKSVIEHELGSFNSFFTAEELYEKVKRKNPKIGIATVYRFLGELKARSLLHSYQCGKKSLYSRSQHSHCHFTCQKCGKTTHLNISSIDFLKGKIHGNICHFQIDVAGICGKCAKTD